MREELELNRRHWDEATALHLRGNDYGLEDFKAGLCRVYRERQLMFSLRASRPKSGDPWRPSRL